MAAYNREIKLPRVMKWQRLVLVNRPELGHKEFGWVCDPQRHVDGVPNEGLCYVKVIDEHVIVTCAFCGYEEEF